MANAAKSYGARLVGSLLSPSVTGKVGAYYVSSSAGKIFPGDPVIRGGSSNSSTVETVSGTYMPGSLPTVAIATAGSGNDVLGFVDSVVPVTGGSPLFISTGESRVVLVGDDPFNVYRMRADGAIAAGSVGANTDLVATNAGDETFATSGWEADATVGTAVAMQLKIVGFPNDIDHTINATGNEVLVVLNTPDRVHDQTGV